MPNSTFKNSFEKSKAVREETEYRLVSEYLCIKCCEYLVTPISLDWSGYRSSMHRLFTRSFVLRFATPRILQRLERVRNNRLVAAPLDGRRADVRWKNFRTSLTVCQVALIN